MIWHSKSNYSGALLLAYVFQIVLCGVLSEFAQAQPNKQDDPLSWDRNIRGIVDRYCTRCHNENKSSGDVNLAQDVDPRRILDHREVWQVALSQIESSEMPPEDAKQPTDEQRAQLIKFLKTTLEDLDCENKEDPGKPILRRLNRSEYDLAVKDLVGLDLELARGFAPDATGHGFDNLGEVLSLSPAQVEQYHDAAKTIVAAVTERKISEPAVFKNVFGDLPAAGSDETAAARAAIERFATRAFRRPVAPEYVERLLKIYDKSRAQSESYEQALGHLVTAVLISPQFLMRIERDRPDEKKAYLIDDYELATRLSFFLWSRPPDAELLELASRQELNKPDVLERMTRQMLRDEHSGALVEHFFGQWLSLREIRTHQPDAKVFPEFDDDLRSAIAQEVRLTLTEIVQQDRPVTEVIDTNYIYLNERLAKHYGLETLGQGAVEGDAMRRVTLEDRRRGGLLTSAALLMLQADPSRTNVPRRGNFIASRILGTPPPPPPPGVPPLDEAAADGKSKSLRELLELHRSKPECANCHAKMDPLGFAFENYDAIGRWRTEDNGFPIDASGMLSSGQLFSGPVELKNLLLEKKDLFSRELIKNLLIYALGRGLQRSDECVVRETLQVAQEHEYRFATIVVEVVKSFPFRYRRNSVD